jgi:hypothetical protein
MKGQKYRATNGSKKHKVVDLNVINMLLARGRPYFNSNIVTIDAGNLNAMFLS